jgi:GNAT superfamily N-acetyltransferase
MQVVRNAVKENVLSDPRLVSDEDYATFLTLRGKGWVCDADKTVVGFSIVDLKEQNIWAIFVQPEYEKKGIGKKLHYIMLSWYFSQTDKKVWLSTSPGTRAEQFYRTAGWKEAGKHGKETKFEMTHKDWKALLLNP